ncbi:hypothetical protein HJC23_000358 [Cyclotella cryptica]|uniref:Uncharacterized protein n=1 Tax=Cyclotella cryptica TaxID=29204 RepID=A0ABD3PNF4_9STRA|eukprot:CCRYP_013036-RC/>CCRYP_013036-RC protein AED:0.02 eAED:0.02 QI:2260/1/1/1/1/0.66/3/935/175
MKQLLILMIIYAWVAMALEKGQSNDDEARYLRTRGTRNICMQLGKPYGRQTLEVPKDEVRFFTSQRRSPPAERGRCLDTEGKKAVKTLKKRDIRTRSFCRKIGGVRTTTNVPEAATVWMLNNGFTEGACPTGTGRTVKNLTLKYVAPMTTTTTTSTSTPKSKETTTTSTTTTKKT